MFQAKVRRVIAQREQEVILSVMSRAEKRHRFRDDTLQYCCKFRADGEIRKVFSRDGDLVRGFRCQWNHQKIFTGQHRRIDQALERCRSEIYLVSSLPV